MVGALFAELEAAASVVLSAEVAFASASVDWERHIDTK